MVHNVQRIIITREADLCKKHVSSIFISKLCVFCPSNKNVSFFGKKVTLHQNFDVPVPQMLEQLPNIVQFFAALSPVPEQVIEVPKILPHDVPMRRSCREPQLVEQLVEVPTIVSSLQRIAEQNVDIPVVGSVHTLSRQCRGKRVLNGY